MIRLVMELFKPNKGENRKRQIDRKKLNGKERKLERGNKLCKPIFRQIQEIQIWVWFKYKIYKLLMNKCRQICSKEKKVKEKKVKDKELRYICKLIFLQNQVICN